MSSSLSVAVSNLTSVSVLVFVLGFLAARLKSDVQIPDQVYQIISVYLLFGIGLKGGVSLHHTSGSGIAKPILMTIALGVVIPSLAFFILKGVKNLNSIDRGAIAAHYGSTSLVTFTAALVFLENSKITYEGFATTLMTIMEVPGIIVGIFLATRNAHSHVSWSTSLKEIVLGKTIVLLVGGLIIGAISGDTGYEKVKPFFVSLQAGILTLFLMHLGYIAGSQIQLIKAAGPQLLLFAIVFPVISGSLGVIGGEIAGLSVGGATVLGILAASASYIAAPAAIGIALPEANKSIAITMSIGVTFPFNLIVGIPLLNLIATTLIS